MPARARRRAEFEQALADLRAADPVLAELMDRLGTEGLTSLAPVARVTTTGRWSGRSSASNCPPRAANAIYARLIDRFGGRPPTPDEVLADDPEELRTAAGLSHAKVAYLRSLAEHVRDGSLALDKLGRLPDDQVIAELVAVKGLGVWSAQMFLMFHLRRPDVLPVGDLGIRRAIMVAYGLDELPAPAEMERIAEPWRPHRTLACVILWRSQEATPV